MMLRDPPEPTHRPTPARAGGTAIATPQTHDNDKHCQTRVPVRRVPVPPLRRFCISLEQIWVENADGSGAVNFLTGMGGFLQAILFGCTGFR